MTGDGVADPAVAAARRVVPEAFGIRDELDAPNSVRGVQAVAAAREALAPFRELIEDARKWKPYDTRDIGDAYLADSVNDLLDELSRLIYREDEL